MADVSEEQWLELALFAAREEARLLREALDLLVEDFQERRNMHYNTPDAEQHGDVAGTAYNTARLLTLRRMRDVDDAVAKMLK